MFPMHWWKSPFFYPIGNSPPALLTQDLAPEENAQILLLGCGDPRNILHTIHASLGNDNRTLDFTCCDLETAVLARNILLLTMIADGISWHYTWRIFYHFYLDSDSLRVLLSQCRGLTQASADLTTWNASTYGKYIRFCTERSMIEIRSHWEHYLSVDVLPEPQKRALRNSFSSSMTETLKNAQTQTGVVSAFRASGPLGGTDNAQNDLFRSFWSTGVMKGRFPHPPASHVNPTFAYSLGGQSEFNVDNTTHAVAAFHLAPVLAQKQRSAHPISAEDLVDAVTTQFSNWCESFHLRVNAVGPSITIRFFAGDCFLFCKALRKFHTTKVTNTGIYARPWGLSQIDFTTDPSDLESSPPPTIFNIIDTSNLADFLGLLNILLVTVPLLQPRPWSVLHTNTVHVCDRSVGTVAPTLSDKLFSDIPTLSLFLGVTPVSYLSDFSTHSPKDAIWSLSWKYPSSVIANKSTPYPELNQDTRVLVCDELQLGKFFHSVYTQMFADENIDHVNSMFRGQNTVQYIRESFVEFLSFIHGRVCVDWTKALASFLHLADSDEKFLLGHRQSYRDLTCQLYLSNVASHNDLRWPFLRDIRSAGDPFEGWDRVPPVVSVTLKVPRQRLKIMEDINRMELGLPVLFCTTAGLGETNVHSSIRPTFGDVVVTGHHQDTQVVIHDDQAGWQGTSPLIVSFDAPSWIFTKAAGMERVALNVHPDHSARLLVQKLGNMQLSIFTRPVTDNKNVWITRFRPNDSQDICRLDSDDRFPGLMETSARIINVDLHASARATSLTLRHTIEDQDIAKNLANGVPVSTKPVADTVVLVSFQGYEQLFKFPIPVNGDKIKTRIARKSSYIELVAPIIRAPEFRSVGILPNPFPIVRTMTSFNLLNIRYIDLSKMPALDLSVSKEKLKWLTNHLELSRATDENHRVAADLKESILTIFLASSGLQRRSTVFELSNPTIGAYAVIVVNGLRLDLSECQTVVADACVIPLDEESGSKVMATLRRGTQLAVTIIRTLDNEMEAWKALLPAVAESCRTWQHNDHCEYRKRGIPACNEDKRASPLCQCGFGKDLGTFASLAAWKEIQSQATRVAIRPLFPFRLPKISSGNIDKDKGILERAGGKPNTVTTCGSCGKQGQSTLMVCSRCKKISYCSKNCQKAHWRTHKPECTS